MAMARRSATELLQDVLSHSKSWDEAAGKGAGAAGCHFGMVRVYLVAHPTARKWVITPVINGISRVNPLITGVISHLLSGMSHQVGSELHATHLPPPHPPPASDSALNRERPLSGHCRTSTASTTALETQCQIECQKECQIDYDRLSKRMSRMSEYMSDRMSVGGGRSKKVLI